MISRYEDSAIKGIFSPKKRLSYFLEIEKLCSLHSDISEELSELLYDSVDKIDLKVLLEDTLTFEKETKHETTAFIKAMLVQIPSKLHPYIHKGMTSSDVLDTCLSMQMKDAIDIVISRMEKLEESLIGKAKEHKETYFLGRSHGKGGEVTSFGLVILGFYTELKRNKERLYRALDEISYGCISGPMGNYSLISTEVERNVCKSLGLNVEPVSTQVLPRDRHAYLMSVLGLIGGFLDRLAIEIRHLSQTGIDEVSEWFSYRQHGSSAMPHKKNPILSENISGLARVIKSNVSPALENISLWYERDMSHSSVERIIIEDSFHLVSFGLDRMNNVISNLFVDPFKMYENIESQKGSYLSHSILFYLMEKGISRNKAYEITQELTKDNSNLIGTLHNLSEFISPKELENLLDLSRFHKSVDEIFNRVLDQ